MHIHTRIEIADEFRASNRTYEDVKNICEKYGISFEDFLTIISNKKYAEDLEPLVDGLRQKRIKR